MTGRRAHRGPRNVEELLRRLTRKRGLLAALAGFVAVVVCGIGVGVAPAQASVMTDRCGAGLIFIGVRGSTEPAGMGNTVGVVNTLLKGDKDIPTWSQALTYPASVFGVGSQEYSNSVDEGASNLGVLLNTIVHSCPYATIAMAGYSQGAQVIGNVLAGSYLAAGAKSHISSVVLFGDPAYTPGEPWDASGNGTGHGLFSRPKGAFASWTRLAYPTPSSTKPVQVPIIRSYCFSGDEFCQSAGFGSAAAAVHASYASKSTYNGYAYIKNWLISQD